MPLLERIAHPIHGSKRRKDRLRQAQMVDADRGLHVHSEGEPQRPLHRPIIEPSDGLPCKVRAHDLECHMPCGVPPERATDLVPRPTEECSRAEGVVIGEVVGVVGEIVGSSVDVRVEEEGAVTAIVPTPEGTMEELVVLEKQEMLGTTVHATHVEQEIIHEQHIEKEFVHEHHVNQEIIHEHHIDQEVIHEKHIDVAVVHEKHIEKPVIHEKHIERPIIHEKHIEQPIIHEKIIEQPIIHEKHIEKPIIHERHIEQPIIHEKHIEKPIIHEKHIEQPVIHERHIEKPIVHETHVEQVVVHQVHSVQPIVHQTHVNQRTIAEHVIAPAVIEQIVVHEQAAFDRDERSAPAIVEKTNETATAIVKVEQDLTSIQRTEQLQSTIIQEVIREDGGILPATIVREEGVIDRAVIVQDMIIADEKRIIDREGIVETLPATVERFDERIDAIIVVENTVEKPLIVAESALSPPQIVQETETIRTTVVREDTSVPLEIIKDTTELNINGLAVSGVDASHVQATVFRADIPPTIVATAPVTPSSEVLVYNPALPPSTTAVEHHGVHHLADSAKSATKQAIGVVTHPIHHHRQTEEERRAPDSPVAMLPV